MELGPDQIIACPHCGGLAQYETLLSGNNFGAQVWTDGKQIAPMLPQPPPVVKCAHCARCYWLADAKEIGTAYLWDKEDRNINPAWRNAAQLAEPDEAEYYAAINSGLAEDRDQERNLRILAWWRCNDEFRDQGAAVPDTARSQSAPAIREARQGNLTRLADLLDDEDDSDRLMKAEVLRELGRFEEAGAILNTVTSKEMVRIASKLRTLCEQRDDQVREISERL